MPSMKFDSRTKLSSSMPACLARSDSARTTYHPPGNEMFVTAAIVSLPDAGGVLRRTQGSRT